MMIFRLLLAFTLVSEFSLNTLDVDNKLTSCYYCAEDSKDKCQPINKSNEELCYVGSLERGEGTMYVAGCVSEQHRLDSEESCDTLNIKYRIIYCNYDNCNTLDQL